MEKNLEFNNHKAIIFATIAAILWSTVATAFKFALEHYNELELLFFASITSFITFMIFGILNGQFVGAFKTTFSNHIKSLIMGALNPFIYYIFLFKAYNLLPAQEAQTLNYSWSIMVVVFSVLFLKQKIKLHNYIAIIISFIGVIVIATKGNIFELKFENQLGVILALGSSIFWAMYWIANIKDKRNNINKLILNFFYGSLFVSIAFFTNNAHLSSFNYNILYCIYIGLFEMGITFIFWMLALKYAENTAKVSNIIYISPFLSLFWINLFLGETIAISTIIGLLLIISGIIFQSKLRFNQKVA